MRLRIAKFLGLGLVGLMAFIAMPVEPAKAQTQADINAAVTAAAGGDATAIVTFLAKFPNAQVAIGDAVAGAINAGGPGVSNLSTALVATGNSGLISGVMVANGMSTTAQNAIAGALVASKDVTLIATVQQQVQSTGSTAIGALSTALTSAPALVIPVSVPVVPPIIVIVPSPAQTPSNCSGGSCN
jgi:hypothetical protein